MFTCSHDLAKSAFLHFDEKIFLLCRWVHFFHFRLYYIYMLKEEVLIDKDFLLAEFVREIIYFNSFIHTHTPILVAYSPKWSQFEIIVILIINWVSFVILMSSGCRGCCSSSVEWQIKLTALAAHVQVIWASI